MVEIKSYFESAAFNVLYIFNILEGQKVGAPETTVAHFIEWGVSTFYWGVYTPPHVGLDYSLPRWSVR